MRIYTELNRTPIDLSYIKDKYYHALEKYKTPLMLYIDTPFCMRNCKFCNCRPYEAKCGGKEYTEYYEYLLKMLDEFSDLIRDNPPSDIYFGGGTPLYMNTSTMESIFSTIPNFMNIPHKIMEGHPALLANSKIDLLIQNKFTYISLGVQSFNLEVLQSQNRLPFDFELVKTKIQRLRANNITVNCDLITYLNGVSEHELAIFSKDLHTMLDLSPDMVTCYYDFYKLKTTQLENRELAQKDDDTLKWIRRYRSTMVKFARKNNLSIPVDSKLFLSEENILNTPTYTTQIYLGDKQKEHAYSCSGFPNYHPKEIALGLGGYGHHVTYGHINREFNYEMRLMNKGLVLEELS